MPQRYADQRAHDVFWMTARERDLKDIREACLTIGDAHDPEVQRWESEGGAAR